MQTENLRELHKKDDNVIDGGGSEELRRENREIHERRRLGNRKLKLLVLLILFVALIVSGIIFLISSRRSYKSYKIVSSIETAFDSDSEYLEFAGNLLKYSPAGVSYINQSGETVWTAGVNMNSPIAEISGGYAVVADKGGNSVAVYNVDGEVTSETMPYKICDVDISSSGAFVVVLESDSANYTSMYSRVGDKIYEIKTSIKNSGYPVDVTLSDDGQKLFTSYLYLSGVTPKINLTAYNFGDVGQNENADRMVGGYSFEDEMIPKVEFVSNDTVAAFTDSEIIIYAMKEKPSEKVRIPYETNILSIFYGRDYVGLIEKNASVVLTGTATDSKRKASDSVYRMKVYDFSGNERFCYDFDMDYERVIASDKEIIISGGSAIDIVTMNGKSRFIYNFGSPVRNIIPTSGRNKYIITFDDRTETIKLSKKEEE